MLTVLLSLLVVLLNVGGVASALLHFGHGEWTAAMGSLVFLLGLDMVGLWLLRGLRSGE